MGVERKGAQEGGYVNNRQPEVKPAAVPEAKQAGEVRARWTWVEPAVWSERMLTALPLRGLANAQTHTHLGFRFAPP